MTKQPKPFFKNFKLKVAGRSWDVIFTDDIKIFNGDFCGLCMYETKSIYVSSSLPRETQILTLWHELMHCAKRNITKPRGTIQEEAAVESDAEFLMEVLPQLLKINKEFITIEAKKKETK